MLEDPSAAEVAFLATSPTCAAIQEGACSATHAACDCTAGGTEQNDAAAAAAAAGSEASAPAAVFNFAPRFGSFVESLAAMAAEEGAEQSPRASAAATARASTEGRAACKGFCRLSSPSRSFVRDRGLNEVTVRSQRDRHLAAATAVAAAAAAAPAVAAPAAHAAPPSAAAGAEAELRRLQADALKLQATLHLQSERRRIAERAATSPPRVAAALSSTRQGAAPTASYPLQAPLPQAPPPQAPLPHALLPHVPHAPSPMPAHGAATSGKLAAYLVRARG